MIDTGAVGGSGKAMLPFVRAAIEHGLEEMRFETIVEHLVAYARHVAASDDHDDGTPFGAAVRKLRGQAGMRPTNRARADAVVAKMSEIARERGFSTKHDGPDDNGIMIFDVVGDAVLLTLMDLRALEAAARSSSITLLYDTAPTLTLGVKLG